MVDKDELPEDLTVATFKVGNRCIYKNKSSFRLGEPFTIVSICTMETWDPNANPFQFCYVIQFDDGALKLIPVTASDSYGMTKLPEAEPITMVKPVEREDEERRIEAALDNAREKLLNQFLEQLTELREKSRETDHNLPQLVPTQPVRVPETPNKVKGRPYIFRNKNWEAAVNLHDFFREIKDGRRTIEDAVFSKPPPASSSKNQPPSKRVNISVYTSTAEDSDTEATR